jgi:hypothetical protein
MKKEDARPPWEVLASSGFGEGGLSSGYCSTQAMDAV